MTLRPSLGSRGHQEVAQLGLEAHDVRLRLTELVPAELAFGSDGVGCELTSDGHVLLRGPQLVHLAHDDVELFVAARQRPQLIWILRESWVGEAGEDL